MLARTGVDALTGVLDRGHLESRGRYLVEQAAAQNRSVSLILIDIDHFKDFNDQFGHAAGDTALKRICRNIASAIRVNDLLFRFGGEEFVVIAEGLSNDQAFALGERIRKRISTEVDAHTRRVTASIGIASRGSDTPGYDAMFASADRRLYRAKGAGRDRTIGDAAAIVASPSLQLAEVG